MPTIRVVLLGIGADGSVGVGAFDLGFQSLAIGVSYADKVHAARDTTIFVPHRSGPDCFAKKAQGFLSWVELEENQKEIGALNRGFDRQAKTT